MIDLNTLPVTPGCYLFKDNKGSTIYIGKAKNIKKRVKSHFQKQDADQKTQIMLSNVASIDVIATDNEVEALFLENTLIKQQQPKYNIRLKDAKTYAFIRVTDEEFPRITIARKKTDRGKYFGPFASATERDEILRFLQKTFMLRTCKKIPKKPCLRHHINACSSPCIGGINTKNYHDNVERTTQVLSGKVQDAINILQKEMKSCSDEHEFERAIFIRNQIKALSVLTEKQKIKRQRKYNEDVINYIVKDNKIHLIVFNIYKGTLAEKNEFTFDIIPEFFDEFIMQYYDEHPVPKEIIIPIQVSDAINSYLSLKKKQRVILTLPKKGEKKQLLDLAKKNVEITFFGDVSKVEALQRCLNLNDLPEIIECFDISHFGGTLTVGSMITFKHGKPDKNNYRRFRIKTVNGINDYAAISEIVRRRYTRLINEKGRMPNLIIIDGGKGQLGVTTRELDRLGLDIPVVAIAKQFEEIYLPNSIEPLRLPKTDKSLKYIQEIRDEAHRFALSYNRLLRKKEVRL